MKITSTKTRPHPYIKPIFIKDYSNQRISCLNLEEKFHSDTTYYGADISDIMAYKSELINISFQNAHINRANFSHAKLRDINFDGTQLNGVNFHNTKFRNVSFVGAISDHCHFIDNLIGAYIWIDDEGYKKITPYNKGQMGERLGIKKKIDLN